MIRYSIWVDAFYLNICPATSFQLKSPPHPFLFSFSVSVIQLWRHLDDSCQDKSWSDFQMPKRIGVSGGKKIHLLALNLIWLIGSTVPAGELGDSNAETTNQPTTWACHWVFLFHAFVYVDREGVKESARGRTGEWRDRVSTRLNPLWPRSSILYRLNATTATPLSSSLLSFLSCGSECETRY